MRTASSRATFINNILSQLASYGFDGIDIVSSSNPNSQFVNLIVMIRIGVRISTSASMVFFNRLPIEYPGVERGGIAEDGQNFLAFLKQLRSAIQSSGRRVEVSFTAPASYW